MHRSPCVCIIQCTTDIIAAHRVCVPQVVAVILENFTSLGNLNPDLVSAHDIQEFKEAWAAYDPDGDGIHNEGYVQMLKFSPATTGNYEYVRECSGRGKCDSEEGACVCDAGFLGSACDVYDPIAF